MPKDFTKYMDNHLYTCCIVSPFHSLFQLPSKFVLDEAIYGIVFTKFWIGYISFHFSLMLPIYSQFMNAVIKKYKIHTTSLSVNEIRLMFIEFSYVSPKLLNLHLASNTFSIIVNYSFQKSSK